MNKFATIAISRIYVPRIRRADAIARRITEMRRQRTRETAYAAGLDGSIFGIHINNYFCSVASGNPWPEVDNSLARKSKWLETHMFDAEKLATSYTNRIERQFGLLDWSVVE